MNVIQRVGFGLLLLLATAAFPAVPELRLVDVLDTWRIDPKTAGLSPAYFGKSADGVHLYKPEGPVHTGTGRVLGTHPNFEGELLSSKVVQRVGVLTPDTDVVLREGMDGRGRRNVFPVFRSLRIDKAMVGTDTVYRGVDFLPQDADVDLRQVRRLQLTDLTLGNADRHGRNIWFYPGPDGILRPLAIDHNFALGDSKLAPNFPDGSAFSRPPIREGQVSSTTGNLLKRNEIYVGALFDPDAHAQYRQEARHIQRSLPDAEIKGMIDSIPDRAFTSEDVPRRRVELYDGLRSRRDSLRKVVDAVFLTAPEVDPGSKAPTTARVGDLINARSWGGDPWDGPRIRRNPVPTGGFGTGGTVPSFHGLESTGGKQARSGGTGTLVASVAAGRGSAPRVRRAPTPEPVEKKVKPRPRSTATRKRIKVRYKPRIRGLR